MTKSEIVTINNKVYHLGLAKGELATNIFLVGDPARASKVARHFDPVTHEVKNREFVTITGTYRGLPVSVIGTGIGTDNVEIALLEAYTLHAFDFDSKEKLSDPPTLTIIRIGTSGGMQADIDPGTLGIATYALGLDSTGLFYDHPHSDDQVLAIEQAAADLLDQATPAGSRFKGKILAYASKASEEMAAELVSQAKKIQADHVTGITVSSPGFYGPSGRYIEGLKNTVPNIKHDLAELNVNGIQAINMEMESSLIFHIAHQLGYRAGTICPIISNPYKSTAIVDYDACVKQAIEIGLAAMTELKPK
ncbi:MAG: nucleoside phosphorylase [Cyclobacteriaceae bacterium]